MKRQTQEHFKGIFKWINIFRNTSREFLSYPCHKKTHKWSHLKLNFTSHNTNKFKFTWLKMHYQSTRFRSKFKIIRQLTLGSTPVGLWAQACRMIIDFSGIFCGFLKENTLTQKDSQENPIVSCQIPLSSQQYNLQKVSNFPEAWNASGPKSKSMKIVHLKGSGHYDGNYSK